MPIQNPKTTFVGYLILGATVLSAAAHYLQTGHFDINYGTFAVSVAGSLGLIAAKDGGH